MNRFNQTIETTSPPPFAMMWLITAILAGGLYKTEPVALANPPEWTDQGVRVDYLGRGLLFRGSFEDATGGVSISLNNTTLQYQSESCFPGSGPQRDTRVVSTLLEVNREYPLRMTMRSLNSGSVEFLFPRRYALELHNGGTTTILEPGGRLPIHNSRIETTVRLVRITNEQPPGISFELPAGGGIPVLMADGVRQTLAHVSEDTELRWSILGPSHGAQIEQSTNSGSAVVKSGRETGLLTIQATSDGAVYQGELELVSPDEERIRHGVVQPNDSAAEREEGAPKFMPSLFALCAAAAVAIVAMIERLSSRPSVH